MKRPYTGGEEKEILAAYIAQHRLKRSGQRELILETFLRAERHVSVDDLLHLVQRRRPDVGRTTVYRTLKLLHSAGLAQELLIDGQTYFEPEYKRQHHDHFICNRCGQIIEFSHPEIERLQETIASELGFEIAGHRHQIFGLCRNCAALRQAPR